MLTPEVAVADLTAFGEGAVVVFEAMGGAVVGYADEEGSSIVGVGESGDGFDGGVLDDFGLLLLFDVPAEGGFVFEVERFAVGAEQVTDGTGLLVGDDGLFLYLGCVDGCYRGLHFLVVEICEHDFVVAVKAGHQRFLELVGKDMIAEGRFVVVDGLVLDLVVVDEVSGGGFEHETVFFGPVGTEAFVDARDDLG